LKLNWDSGTHAGADFPIKKKNKKKVKKRILFLTPFFRNLVPVLCPGSFKNKKT
jgi:hypothetical protein